MSIRKMAPEDVASIAKLSEEGFSDSYQFDWQANAKALHEAVVGGRAFVAVAEGEGKVIGYCNLRSWPAGGWVDQIVVSRSERGQGVGRALLEAILAEAAGRKYWKVSLIASEGNAVARSFFQSCGWEIVGQMRDEIKPGINGILMSRIVDYGLHPNQ
jgi:ribosomal-protein-alanine N-acetyltransferase